MEAQTTQWALDQGPTRFHIILAYCYELDHCDNPQNSRRAGDGIRGFSNELAGCGNALPSGGGDGTEPPHLHALLLLPGDGALTQCLCFGCCG